MKESIVLDDWLKGATVDVHQKGKVMCRQCSHEAYKRLTDSTQPLAITLEASSIIFMSVSAVLRVSFQPMVYGRTQYGKEWIEMYFDSVPRKGPDERLFSQRNHYHHHFESQVLCLHGSALVTSGGSSPNCIKMHWATYLSYSLVSRFLFRTSPHLFFDLAYIHNGSLPSTSKY